MTVPADPWSLVSQAADAIAERTGIERHDVLVVLGSGWTPAADRFGEVNVELPIAELPGFTPVGVVGHAGILRSVAAGGGKHFLALLGRVHAYEGHDLSTVVHGVRAAIQAGCGTVVLTNAAGGLRAGMRVGQPVLIADHLNLTARSPLTGPAAPDELGLARFVDMTEAYDPSLRAIASVAAPAAIGRQLREAIYAGMAGPAYETPAEVRMLALLGADATGMSTVPEVIVARAIGMRVLGFSCITNLACGLSNTPITHAEVLETTRRVSETFTRLVAGVVAKL
jgi:purine-nucleoside phosphorylase